MIYKQALLCYGLFHDIQTSSIMLWVVSWYTNKLYYVMGSKIIQEVLYNGALTYTCIDTSLNTPLSIKTLHSGYLNNKTTPIRPPKNKTISIIYNYITI